jgi:RNA polymerase sporulation-specific sigma factor
MQVMALLSAREWEILQHILDGESYAEAADGLQISVKSVDNAMQRIRRKMRAVRSTEYFGK